MLFWIVIVALSLSAALFLARIMLRAPGDAPPAAAYDLQIYRDQLKEVDRDLARGVLSQQEAQRVRTEVSRRILAADAQLQAEEKAEHRPQKTTLAIVSIIVAGLVGGSLLLYGQLGAPGYDDFPLESRIAASDAARAELLSQAEIEAQLPKTAPTVNASDEFLELMVQLRQVVKNRPEDLQGLELLVRNEATLGNLAAAHLAQAQLIKVKEPEATAQDYSLLADLMIGAAGGNVSNEAEVAIRESLRRDPNNPAARYYLGLFMMQVDRPDVAFRTWDALLQESAPDAPWTIPIRSQIVELARRAGIDYQLPDPPTTPGPTSEDIDAASAMSDAERQSRIQGMVEGLSARLVAEGGAPEEWAQLINAYAVLGDTNKAEGAWRDAQEAFANNPAALDAIRAAAQATGVVE